MKKNVALEKENEIEKHKLSKTTIVYTTVSVKLEENRIVRIADRLQEKDGVFWSTFNASKEVSTASECSWQCAVASIRLD
jgi:hypothetical protein